MPDLLAARLFRLRMLPSALGGGAALLVSVGAVDVG